MASSAQQGVKIRGQEATEGQAKISVGIVLFDDVEVLDFAGPFEVFSITSKEFMGEKVFDVSTIGETGKIISARNGLEVQPKYSFENAPHMDIIVVPGGMGTRREVNNPHMIAWIKERATTAQITSSVCTGSFLLAKAGLLDGKKATSHGGRLDALEQEFPEVTVVRGVKFVDEGHIVTAGGISAGINMAFAVVKRLAGLEAAKRTAKIMEYDIDLD